VKTRTVGKLAILPTVLTDCDHRTFGYATRRQGCARRIAGRHPATPQLPARSHGPVRRPLLAIPSIAGGGQHTNTRVKSWLHHIGCTINVTQLLPHHHNPRVFIATITLPWLTVLGPGAMVHMGSPHRHTATRVFGVWVRQRGKTAILSRSLIRHPRTSGQKPGFELRGLFEVTLNPSLQPRPLHHE
jgi:hypothetical protein